MCNQPDTASTHKVHKEWCTRGWEESALGEPHGQGHSRISSSTCTCGLQVFGHTCLVVHLCSPELRLHDAWWYLQITALCTPTEGTGLNT